GISEGGVYACELVESGDIHRLFVAVSARPWHWNNLESDARFLYCGASATGAEVVILCGASYAKLHGEFAFQLDQPVARLEASLHGQPRLTCSDPGVLEGGEEIYAVLRELHTAACSPARADAPR
ncbi:MAG: hypothetical protein ABSD20_12405, partial [Terriglobales bacterium]